MAECESLIRDFKAALATGPVDIKLAGLWSITVRQQDVISVGAAGIQLKYEMVFWHKIQGINPLIHIKCELGYN